METKEIESVLLWMKTTDLVEVAWKKGREVLELKLSEPGPAVFIPESRLTAVPSPDVGVFRFGRPGFAKKVEEGNPVKTGAVMGLVESAGRKKDVKSPASGTIRQVLIEEGKAVEYGQPLFLIQEG